MATVGTTRDAIPEARETPGGMIQVKQYIGSLTRLHRGPQAFTSTFPPGYVIAPHFHRTDQVQLFVDGSASIGPHPLDPVTLHYADGFTAYGPIVVGESGMTFFNLRARCDVGAHWMPESRKQLERPAGRSLTVACRLSLDSDVASLRLETLIDLCDDGLAVYEAVARPGVALLDAVAGGNGRFQVVLAGSVVMDDTELAERAVAYVHAGERFPLRRAGADGVHLLEMQFPSE
jgi:hypothetical protein